MVRKQKRPFACILEKRRKVIGKKTKQNTLSIPILDGAVQPGGDDFARLLGMPLRARHRPLARHDLVQHLGALPIIKTDKPTRVARHHELPVRADVDVDPVPGAVVALEHFLAVLSESIRRCVHHDLVVAGLKRDRFARRMRRCPHETVHVRLGDSLDGHWDADFPCQDGFVV